VFCSIVLDEVDVTLKMPRSLSQCCLGMVGLLVVAGGAADVLPVLLSCPLPLRKAHPSPVIIFFVVLGAIHIHTHTHTHTHTHSVSQKR